MLDSAKEDDDAVGLGTTNLLHADEIMDLAERYASFPRDRLTIKRIVMQVKGLGASW